MKVMKDLKGIKMNLARLQYSIFKMTVLGFVILNIGCQSSGPTPHAMMGASMNPTVGANADNLLKYFGKDPATADPVILFRGTKNLKANSPADVTTYLNSTPAECQQYIMLTNHGSCSYLSTQASITTKLAAFQASPQNKYLVLGPVLNFKNIDYSADANLPQYNPESDTPFMLLPYLIDLSNSSAHAIYILNPAYVRTEVVSPSANTFSMTQVLPGFPGWYTSTFLSYASDGSISGSPSFVVLKNEQIGGVNLGLTSQKLPRVRVAAVPAGTSAASAESRMATIQTDQFQSPLRDAEFESNVNVASGELRFARQFLSTPNVDGSPMPPIVGIFSSFFGHFGDFGYGWGNRIPRKIQYELVTPAGSPADGYSFLLENALVHFIPQGNQPFGLFWGVNPNDPTKPSAMAPDFARTRLFQARVGSTDLETFTLDGRLTRRTNSRNSNSTTILYNGGHPVLSLDQIAARSSYTDKQTIINNFEWAAAQIAATPAAVDLTSDGTHKTIQYQGNYIYEARRPSGEVAAHVLKDGSYVSYAYDAGNLLHVKKYHPSLPSNTEAKKLFEFTYTNTTAKNNDPVWTRLVTEVKDHDSGIRDSSFKVTYANQNDIYGLVPVVSQISYRRGTSGSEKGLLVNFAFDFKHVGEQSSTVTYSSGELYKYYFEDGFIYKKMGPGKTGNQEVMYQALRDPKTGRRVNTIVRGVEEIVELNAQGFIVSKTQCADRTVNLADPSSALLPTLATLTSDGEVDSTTLKCDAASGTGEGRKTLYTASKFQAYFEDPAANFIIDQETAPVAQLPDASGNLQSSSLVTQYSMNGCFLFPGSISVSAMKSGVYCDLVADNTNGGSWLKKRMKETYEDGCLKSELTGLLPVGAPGGPTAPTISNSDPAIFKTSQVGYYASVPSTGVDRVGTYNATSTCSSTTTLGNKDLTRKTTELHGVQGELLYQKYGWGAETYFVYDYINFSSPRLLYSKTVNISPIATIPVSDGEQQPIGGGGSNGLVNAVTALSNFSSATFENGAIDTGAYLTALNEAFTGTEATTQFSNVVFYDAEGRINKTYKNGSTTTMTFGAHGFPTEKSETVQVAVGESARTDVTTYAYDIHGRRESEQDPENTITTFSYGPDGQISETIVDRHTHLNYGKTHIKPLTWDYSLRPLSIKTNISDVTTVAKPTTMEYVRNAYGDITEEKKCTGTDCSTALFTQTTTHTVDGMSGIVTATSVTMAGTNVDTTPQTVEYKDFNSYRRPLVEYDATRKIKKVFSGTPGRKLTEQTFTPDLFATGSVSSTAGLQTVKTWDGCGNVVKSTVTGPTTAQTINAKKTVEYDLGLCKISSSYEATLNDNTAAWEVRLGYLTDGTAVAEDDRMNTGMNDGTLRLSRNLLRCRVVADKLTPECVGNADIVNFSVKGRKPANANQIHIVDGYSNLVNHRGTVLKSTRFLPAGPVISTGEEDSIFETTSVDSVAANGTTNTTIGTTQTFNLVGETQIEQSKNGVATYISNEWRDVGLGVKKLSIKSRKNPRSGQFEAQTETPVLDELGRTLSSETTVALGSTTDRVTQMQINHWTNGTPDSVSEHRAIGSSITIDTSALNENFVLNQPLKTTLSKTIADHGESYSMQSVQTTVRDGLGRPTSVTYSENMPALHDFVDLQSVHTRQYDLLNRVKQEVVTLTPSAGALVNATYNLGTVSTPVTVQRNAFTTDSVQVDYEFTGTGFKMKYAGFEVTYKVNANPLTNISQIVSVSVKDPQNNVFDYFDDRGEYTGDPYIGLVDETAGNFSTSPWYLNIWRAFTGTETVNLSMQESPGFQYTYYDDQDELQSSLDVFLRDQSMNFEDGVLQSLSTSESHGDRPRIWSVSQNLPSTRSGLETNKRSCDAMGLNPLPNRTYTPILAKSSTSSQNASDYYNYYGLKDGRMASARRSHKFEASGTESVRIDIHNAYDLFGANPAISEQAFIPSWAGTKPFWLKQNRRFNFPAPEMTNFSQKYLTLVEDEITRSSTETSDYNKYPDRSDTTRYIHVYGPMGILFSFYYDSSLASGHQWVKRAYIRDRIGNIILARQNFSSHGMGTVPVEIETFGPFGASAVHRYKNVSYNSTTHSYNTGSEESADAVELSRSGFDPIDPPNLPFGFAGAQRDLVFSYFDGEAYDPYVGQVAQLRGSDDTVCEGQSSMTVSKAQAFLDSARSRTVGQSQGNWHASIASTREAQELVSNYLFNLPPTMLSNPYTAGLSMMGLFWDLKTTGHNWVLRDSLGVAYHPIAAVDRLITSAAFDAETDWGGALALGWNASGFVPGPGLWGNLINYGLSAADYAISEALGEDNQYQ